MMVSLTKRKVKGTTYYYLSYSYREGKQVKLIERELGKDLPEDLNRIREDFIIEIVLKRWIPRIEQIKKTYTLNQGKLINFIKEKNLKDFGIRFTYNTNKIEGSTLTLLEVKLAIEDQEVSINKPTMDVNEAQCHMLAYEDMIKNTSEVSLDLILKWHRLLFSMHPNRNNFAGLVRKDQIYISGSKFVPPPGGRACQMLLDDLFRWFKDNKNRLHPVLLSCLMHLRLVSIHPFIDGNGRITRLLMNYILFKSGFPMFNISAERRKSYINALERANLKEDEMMFVGWFFKNYLKSIETRMV